MAAIIRHFRELTNMISTEFNVPRALQDGMITVDQDQFNQYFGQVKDTIVNALKEASKER